MVVEAASSHPASFTQEKFRCNLRALIIDLDLQKLKYF